tara:strand:+ start:1165 stop:1347 length:183 start_codon:yes stop_codon:yes gene_type:complete
MLEAEITTSINAILFPFMLIITVFISSAIMLSYLPWTDADDDDDGSDLITTICSYAPQRA